MHVGRVCREKEVWLCCCLVLEVLRNLGLLAKIADSSCNSAAVPAHSDKGKGADCPEAITRAKLLKIKALPFKLSIPDIPHPNNPTPGMGTTFYYSTIINAPLILIFLFIFFLP